MRRVATTKLSPKGEVVILELVEAPDISEFGNLAAETRRKAKEAGITEEDVAEAIRAVRSGD